MENLGSLLGSVVMVAMALATQLVWRFLTGTIAWRYHHVLYSAAVYRGEFAESSLVAGLLLILVGVLLARTAH